MDFDFTPYFKRYEELAKVADGVFERLRKEYPDCVTCKVECADCCHALFDLTLIEALYLNRRFLENFNGDERERILEEAGKRDREIYKIKRNAFKDFQAGKSEEEILNNMAEERVRCPLLNNLSCCALYDARPLTCRFYGLPTAIGGKAHTCGISGFKEGTAYPTVNLDAIHNKLLEISSDLVKDLKVKNFKTAEILVPLSMALLTSYDSVYFGSSQEEEKP